jgi:hypothetical protein
MAPSVGIASHPRPAKCGLFYIVVASRPHRSCVALYRSCVALYRSCVAPHLCNYLIPLRKNGFFFLLPFFYLSFTRSELWITLAKVCKGTKIRPLSASPGGRQKPPVGASAVPHRNGCGLLRAGAAMRLCHQGAKKV